MPHPRFQYFCKQDFPCRLSTWLCSFICYWWMQRVLVWLVSPSWSSGLYSMPWWKDYSVKRKYINWWLCWWVNSQIYLHFPVYCSATERYDLFFSLLLSKNCVLILQIPIVPQHALQILSAQNQIRNARAQQTSSQTLVGDVSAGWVQEDPEAVDVPVCNQEHTLKLQNKIEDEELLLAIWTCHDNFPLRVGSQSCTQQQKLLQWILWKFRLLSFRQICPILLKVLAVICSCKAFSCKVFQLFRRHPMWDAMHCFKFRVWWGFRRMSMYSWHRMEPCTHKLRAQRYIRGRERERALEVYIHQKENTWTLKLLQIFWVKDLNWRHDDICFLFKTICSHRNIFIIRNPWTALRNSILSLSCFFAGGIEFEHTQLAWKPILFPGPQGCRTGLLFDNLCSP